MTTTATLPPPFIAHPNGNVTTYSCNQCRFTWGWTAREIDQRAHDRVLDAHLAEHSAVVATGRSGK